MDRRFFVFVNLFHARHVRENGIQLLVVFFDAVCIGFRLCIHPGSHQGMLPSLLWRKYGQLCRGRPERPLFCPALPEPRPAAGPCAGPLAVCPGFVFDMCKNDGRSSFLVADHSTDTFFIPVNIFYARYVRENYRRIFAQMQNL